MCVYKEYTYMYIYILLFIYIYIHIKTGRITIILIELFRRSNTGNRK